MRILLVAPCAIETPPIFYGGMEREVNWLSMGLTDLGHEVLTLARTGSTVATLAGEGESEVDFVELAKGLDYDVIIDFSHDKLVTRTFPDAPQINTYQVMVIQWDKNPVFISNGQRAHCQRPDGVVIYYGLNVPEYPFYEGPREDYLLYMGSLIVEKRVHWVSELAKRVGMRCKIAGPGWQPEYWPTLEEMKKQPHVEFVGDVGGERKLDLIQKARCLVHPVGGANWVEAGAIIVLESLMCGTPVITSTNGCLPEYIIDFHNGFTCQSLDEMEHCFKWLDQVRPQDCRNSVVEHFNKERMAEEYAQLAQQVIEGRTW